MMVLNAIAATLIGCMAGLGIGGGGLLVIYLTLVMSVEQLSAQGINLAFFVFSALASLFVHFKKRNLNIRRILILAVTGIVSSLMGSYVSRNISTELLQKIFGALLVITGLMSLLKKEKKQE